MVCFVIAAFYYRMMLEVPNYQILAQRTNFCEWNYNATFTLLRCGNSVYPVNVLKIETLGSSYSHFLFFAQCFGIASGLSCSFVRFSVLRGRSVAEIGYDLSRKSVVSKLGNSTFNPGLSGLRGLAALGVGLYHSIQFSLPQPLATISYPLYIGVPIFFMLSMFLLLQNLERNYDLKRYFKRRILRIWPIYFGSLLAFYLLGFPGMNLTTLLEYMTFTQYFLYPNSATSTAGVFWTLQIEEVAYLFIPLIAVLSLKNKRILGIAMCLIGIYFYLANVMEGPAFILKEIIPACLLPYGLGLVAYSFKFPPISRLLAPAGLLLLVAQGFGLSADSLAASFSLTLIYYCMLLIGLCAVLRNTPAFLGKFTLLGEISYAFYAVHEAFILAFGLVGLVFAGIAALAVEFPLRRKEITKRLRSAYLHEDQTEPRLLVSVKG